MKGQYELARWLLMKGANPNGQFVPGNPLATAVIYENQDIVKLLLEFDADPDVINSEFHQSARQIADEIGNDNITSIISKIPPK